MSARYTKTSMSRSAVITPSRRRRVPCSCVERTLRGHWECPAVVRLLCPRDECARQQPLKSRSPGRCWLNVLRASLSVNPGRCWWWGKVVVAQEEVTLEADKPYLKVRLHGVAEVECCYTSAEPLTATWVRKNGTGGIEFLNLSDHVTKGSENMGTTKCSMLVLKSVELSDAGLYQCLLNNSNIEQYSHGTYLHVYTPIHKMLTISERTKNNILTAEGILLLLCVLLPATTILFKNKRQYELEKKKVTRESENIYQGLNLDECCPKYDQIERSHDHGPYQDVCSASDEEEFNLEKP